MKKYSVVILFVLCSIVACMHICTCAQLDIYDISGHWAEENIRSLMDRGIISGYCDRTFRPGNYITLSEYIKMIVCSMGGGEGKSQNGYWAEYYIRHAVEKGYLIDGEFENPEKHINRTQLVRIALRVLNQYYQGNIHDLSSYIKDYANMTETQKFEMLRAYTAGIINGFPDGNFDCEKLATRAEASTLVLRILDASNRILPELNSDSENEFVEPKIIVEHNENPYQPFYFCINIDNYQDYSDDYKFIIDFINYPELNEREQKWGEWTKIRINQWRSAEYVKRNGGQLFSLPKSFYTNRENKQRLSIKPGMQIEYVISISNKQTQKSYPGMAVVKLKEFK